MKNNNQKCNIIVIFAIILFGCGFAFHTFSIGNPAAVYCEKLGYQHIVKETEEGQFGFCKFPDGSEASEWKFFIGEEAKEYSYCQKKEYEIKTITSNQCQYASKCAVCVLKDGTEVEVTKLVELDLKSTIVPWDPDSSVKPVNSETKKPTEPIEPKANYFLYIIIFFIFLAIAFVVYKKIKDRDDY